LANQVRCSLNKLTKHYVENTSVIMITSARWAHSMINAFYIQSLLNVYILFQSLSLTELYIGAISVIKYHQKNYMSLKCWILNTEYGIFIVPDLINIFTYCNKIKYQSKSKLKPILILLSPCYYFIIVFPVEKYSIGLSLNIYI